MLGATLLSEMKQSSLCDCFIVRAGIQKVNKYGEM